MKKLINPIYAKLIRIKKQKDILIKSIKEWSESESIVTESKIKEDRLGYDLMLKSFKEPLMLEQFEVELGEIIHNLRSSIDNLAYALACIKLDPPLDQHNIYFPIYDEKQKFDKKRKVLEKIFLSEVFNKIELIQPFQRDGREGNGYPKDDPLILLSRLSNNDKHRKPTIVFLSPKEIKWDGTVEYFNEEDCKKEGLPNVIIFVNPLSEGIKLMEYITTFPIEKANGSFQYQIQIEIEHDGLRYPLFETIEKLYWYVCLVVDNFSCFFNKEF